MARFTIDELAHEAGTKVSTIRLYQQRGLLPPPAIQGRVGYYDDTHLARLRLVADLRGRGYSLAAIRDLADTWESGRDLGAVLGVERALGGGVPRVVVSREQLEREFPDLVDQPALLKRIERLGAARVRGDEVDADAGFLEVGRTLRELGVPLVVMLDEFERVQAFADDAGRRYVELFEQYVWDPSLAQDAAALQRAATAIQSMRESATAVVTGALHQAIDAAAADAVARHAEELTRAVAPRKRRRVG
jgi:DNA-binding transcriptional MerR regulator